MYYGVITLNLTIILHSRGSSFILFYKREYWDTNRLNSLSKVLQQNNGQDLDLCNSRVCAFNHCTILAQGLNE